MVSVYDRKAKLARLSREVEAGIVLNERVAEDGPIVFEHTCRLGTEGIAKVKAAGVYKGRKPSIDAARVREMKANGLGPTEIAKALGIGRASVYRVLLEGSP
jgi:Helix-turn-helix domain of resolvase